VSYNEPKLDPLAVWNPNGITFADSTIVGQTPVGIFINRNNNIYLAGRKNSEILIWRNDDISPTTTIYTSSFQQEAIFVTINDEILTSTRYHHTKLINGIHKQIRMILLLMLIVIATVYLLIATIIYTFLFVIDIKL